MQKLHSWFEKSKNTKNYQVKHFMLCFRQKFRQKGDLKEANSHVFIWNELSRFRGVFGDSYMSSRRPVLYGDISWYIINLITIFSNIILKEQKKTYTNTQLTVQPFKKILIFLNLHRAQQLLASVLKMNNLLTENRELNPQVELVQKYVGHLFLFDIFHTAPLTRNCRRRIIFQCGNFSRRFVILVLFYL